MCRFRNKKTASLEGGQVQGREAVGSDVVHVGSHLQQHLQKYGMGSLWRRDGWHFMLHAVVRGPLC